jgi:hypothetical protein
MQPIRSRVAEKRAARAGEAVPRAAACSGAPDAVPIAPLAAARATTSAESRKLKFQTLVHHYSLFAPDKVEELISLLTDLTLAPAARAARIAARFAMAPAHAEELLRWIDLVGAEAIEQFGQTAKAESDARQAAAAAAAGAGNATLRDTLLAAHSPELALPESSTFARLPLAPTAVALRPGLPSVFFAEHCR